MKLLRSGLHQPMAEMIRDILKHEGISCEIVPLPNILPEVYMGQGAFYNLLVDDEQFQNALDIIELYQNSSNENNVE